MALSENVFDVFVIRAKREVFGIDLFRHNAPYDIFQIAGGAPLPDMHVDPPSHLFQRIGKGRRLVVGIHARHLIGRQLFVGKIGGVSVNGAVFKESKLGKHSGISL